MLFGRFWLPSVPALTPPNALTSESALIAPSVLQEPPAPLRRVYPDHAGHDTSGPHWGDALVATSIVNDIPTLPLAIAVPLTQIADIVSVTLDAVKVMRENREECTHLVDRVVRFLRSLIDNLKASNVCRPSMVC